MIPYYLGCFTRYEVVSVNSDGTYVIKPVNKDKYGCGYIELNGRLMINTGAGGSGNCIATTFSPVHVTSKTDTRIEFSYIMINYPYHQKMLSVRGAVVRENEKWKLDWCVDACNEDYTNFLENWGDVGSFSDRIYDTTL